MRTNSVIVHTKKMIAMAIKKPFSEQHLSFLSG